MNETSTVEFVGRSGQEGQGSFYAITLKIEEGRIISASHRTYACPWAGRIGERLAEMVKGKTLGEAIRVTEIDLDIEAGPVPRPKRHLMPLAIQALRDAVTQAVGNTVGG